MQEEVSSSFSHGEQGDGGQDGRVASNSGEKQQKDHISSPCLSSEKTITATKQGIIKAIYLGRLGRAGGIETVVQM